MADVTILHTNDFHNRLDAPLAARLRSSKVEHDAVLLDGGDAVWAGNVYFRPGGERALELMSEAGYDAMVVGNREFHFTSTGFRSKLSRASYTILCANIRSVSDTAPPCQPSLLFKKNDVRIGIFGVTVPMVTPRSRAAAFSAFIFDDPIETASATAEALRPECDLLIALTHIGLSQDKLLAERVGALDLIVGGHSHDSLSSPVVINEVPIVQAGSYGHFLGIVEMTKTACGWMAAGHLEPLREANR